MSTSPLKTVRQIRPLTSQDGAAYQTLRLEAVTEFPDSFLSTTKIESNRPLLSFQYELQAAIVPPLFSYYGIFQDGQLLGYTQLGCSLLPKQLHIAFIYNLYISRAHHQQGLAKQLIQHCVHQLKTTTQIERVFVACNANNPLGVAFYTALGFKIWGKRPKSVLWQGVYDDEVEWVLELR
jgi:ribosomal protein S18 acetylase RimI-like enzyme